MIRNVRRTPFYLYVFDDGTPIHRAFPVNVSQILLRDDAVRAMQKPSFHIAG